MEGPWSWVFQQKIFTTLFIGRTPVEKVSERVLEKATHYKPFRKYQHRKIIRVNKKRHVIFKIRPRKQKHRVLVEGNHLLPPSFPSLPNPNTIPITSKKKRKTPVYTPTTDPTTVYPSEIITRPSRHGSKSSLINAISTKQQFLPWMPWLTSAGLAGASNLRPTWLWFAVCHSLSRNFNHTLSWT